MQVDVENSEGHDVPQEDEQQITQALRDFADWIYDQLEIAYEYDTSEENAREYLADDDREYTADGDEI